MIADMKPGWVLLAALVLATSVSIVSAAEAGPIPRSIAVSEAVGKNPSTIYTAAQTQRTVNVSSNSSTVNCANQTKLRRGQEGVKGQGAVAAPPETTRKPPLTFCDAASVAQARNSPAAPGLEAQCLGNTPERDDFHPFSDAKLSWPCASMGGLAFGWTS